MPAASLFETPKAEWGLSIKHERGNRDYTFTTRLAVQACTGPHDMQWKRPNLEGKTWCDRILTRVASGPGLETSLRPHGTCSRGMRMERFLAHLESLLQATRSMRFMWHKLKN